MAKIITYECAQCGSEVVVTEAAGARMSPIYCCGISVIKTRPGKKSPAKTKKKVASKKPAAKKTAAKKPAAKKKAKR